VVEARAVRDRSPIDGATRTDVLLGAGARTFFGVPSLADLDALRAQVAFLDASRPRRPAAAL